MRVTLVLGAATTAVGAAALSGWVLDLPVLVYLVPGLPAMQVSAAIGCMTAGASVSAAALRRPRLQAWAAGATLVLGLATLLTFLAGLPRVVTLDFFFPAIAEGTLRPRIMAPNAALCFVLLGAALLLPRREWREETVALVLELAGLTLVLVGGVDALLLLAERLGPAGPLPAQMALHTAVVAVGLGVALLRYQARRLAVGNRLTRRVPRAVGVVAVVLFLAIAQFMRANQRAFVDQITEVAAELVRRDIAQGVRDRMEELAERVAFEPVTDVGFPEVTAVVRLRPGEVEPGARGAPSGTSGGRSEGRPLRLDASAQWDGLRLVRGDLTGGTSDASLIVDGSAQGPVVAAIEGGALLDPIVAATDPAYGVIVWSDRRELARSAELDQASSFFAQEMRAEIGTAGWSIVVWPTAGWRSELRRPFPLGILVGGIGLAFLLAVSIQSDRSARIQAGDLENALTSLREEERDRRRAEAALLESETRLRQSRKMEALGRLAGGVSHDFNSLLGGIRRHADLLEERAAHDPPLREAVREIRKSSESASDLTRQLLAFSSRHVLRPSVVDLSAVVEEMADAIRGSVGESVEVRLSAFPRALPVLVDAAQLRSMIVHFASNARDAMPDGGVLEIMTGARSVGVEGAVQLDVAPGAYAQLSVADSGVGMSRDLVRHIFDPFFTTKERARGTGLGLALVYGFVRQSGGAIQVESEPGRGSTFYVLLPESTDRPALRPTRGIGESAPEETT